MNHCVQSFVTVITKYVLCDEYTTFIDTQIIQLGLLRLQMLYIFPDVQIGEENSFLLKTLTYIFYIYYIYFYITKNLHQKTFFILLY